MPVFFSSVPTKVNALKREIKIIKIFISLFYENTDFMGVKNNLNQSAFPIYK